MRKHIRIEWASLPSSPALSMSVCIVKRGDAQGGNEKYKKPQLRLFFSRRKIMPDRPVCSISLDTSSIPIAYYID